MGYFLFQYNTLEDLILARDKYLKPEGLVFPDIAKLYSTSMEDGIYRDDRLKFWDNVYGINMKVMKQWVIGEPVNDIIST